MTRPVCIDPHKAFCRGCSRELPLTEFFADASKASGKCTRCCTCKRAQNAAWRVKNRASAATRTRRYYAQNRDAIRAKSRADYSRVERRDQRLRETYGISLLATEYLLAEQGGVCAICKVAPRKDQNFHVDHDHSSGQIRGILCGKCNPGLGMFGDSAELLRAAVIYIETHSH